MAEGTFPDVLKVSRVTPVFKKGNPEDVGNYRPVSTLPIFGKIFEKVMYSRIYNFALSQGIIDKNQIGNSPFGIVHSYYELYGSLLIMCMCVRENVPQKKSSIIIHDMCIWMYYYYIRTTLYYMK